MAQNKHNKSAAAVPAEHGIGALLGSFYSICKTLTPRILEAKLTTDQIAQLEGQVRSHSCCDACQVSLPEGQPRYVEPQWRLDVYSSTYTCTGSLLLCRLCHLTVNDVRDVVQLATQGRVDMLFQQFLKGNGYEEDQSHIAQEAFCIAYSLRVVCKHIPDLNILFKPEARSGGNNKDTQKEQTNKKKKKKHTSNDTQTSGKAMKNKKKRI